MKTARLALRALLIFSLAPAPAHAEAEKERARAEHIVLIVWDGMRPDFVSERNTPTLWKLAGEGVIFRNHHSVFPTLTSVNGPHLPPASFPTAAGRLETTSIVP